MQYLPTRKPQQHAQALISTYLQFDQGIQAYNLQLFIYYLDILLSCPDFIYNLQLIMPKQTKKEVKKCFPLFTTPQSNAYKEQVKKEGAILLADAQVKLQRLTQQQTIPTYMSIYRKNYDGHNAVHQLDELQQKEYHYDQKAKRDRHFNIKKQGQTKESYQFPLTTNQTYGWRQPVDTLAPNHGVKQTFDQKLFMTLKALKPGVVKK